MGLSDGKRVQFVLYNKMLGDPKGKTCAPGMVSLGKALTSELFEEGGGGNSCKSPLRALFRSCYYNSGNQQSSLFFSQGFGRILITAYLLEFSFVINC